MINFLSKIKDSCSLMGLKLLKLNVVIFWGGLIGCTSNEIFSEGTSIPLPIPSLSWQQFVLTKQQGTPAPFPDFSYAGYKLGVEEIPSPDWPIINVLDYGAIPDDEISDTQAINHAIKLALSMQGAIVYFPQGRYLIDGQKEQYHSIIKVAGDNIILRGAGSGSTGTELFFKDHLNTKTPNKLWTTPEMIEFTGSESFYKGEQVTKVSSNALLGDFRIEVNSVSNLSIGDHIVINLYDNNISDAPVLAPYTIETEWRNFNEGEVAREYHKIIDIVGNTVILEAPLHMDIDASFNWQIRTVQLGKMVGVEDLALVGNWQGNFQHHKDHIHDSGWSALKLDKYSDSWIKNVRFKDWNEVLTINAGYGISVINVVIEGNRGHFGVHVTSSYGVLVTHTKDIGGYGQYHAMSVSSYASGTVFHRVEWPQFTSFDTHARYPHATLFDHAIGGFSGAEGGVGGGRLNKPNHLHDLVLWNFYDLGKSNNSAYNWWEGNYVLMPKIIGWYGTQPIFIDEQLAVKESIGGPVLPESLYEAQLALRLGKLPCWLIKLNGNLENCSL